MADGETTYHGRRGIFNDLFAVATPQFQEVPGSGSPLEKNLQRESVGRQEYLCGFQTPRLRPKLFLFEVKTEQKVASLQRDQI